MRENFVFHFGALGRILSVIFTLRVEDLLNSASFICPFCVFNRGVENLCFYTSQKTKDLYLVPSMICIVIPVYTIHGS